MVLVTTDEEGLCLVIVPGPFLYLEAAAAAARTNTKIPEEGAGVVVDGKVIMLTINDKVDIITGQ